ncbi:MAG: ComEC/Rec2 family competence protein, partial [Oscillospiraceae bacterium]|nr:ComEC/Rec2 family competence protein [Oscillospiraceae bacterium]
MRKLATAAFSFAAAIFLSLYLLANHWLLIGGALVAAASLCGLLFKGDVRVRIFIVCVSFAVGLIWSWAFSAIVTAPAGELHDQFATVTAVVTDFPVPRTRGYHVEVRIRQHEGEDIRPIGARLRYFRTTELQPGDVIEFMARFSRTDGVDDLDRIDALSSRGAFLSALIASDIEVVGSAGRWRYFPQRLSYAMANMADRLFPEDVSPFMQALIVGRRADLSTDVGLNAALAASGITHVVSVSGLHVTFLMGFLAVFIDRKKRLFAMIGLPVLFLFMMMTGLQPPVVRAGIMQMFLICGPIFGRKSDSITSISASLLILLAMNPYSAGSIGLQLSFSATVGLILFTPRIHLVFTNALRRTKLYDKSVRAHVLRVITSSLSTTFGAILLTIPLTAIHFGRVAIASPITNLLTLWAVSIAFTFGMVASVLGFIFMPLGAVVAYPVT